MLDSILNISSTYKATKEARHAKLVQQNHTASYKEYFISQYFKLLVTKLCLSLLVALHQELGGSFIWKLSVLSEAAYA